jgi:hypothetical protein
MKLELVMSVREINDENVDALVCGELSGDDYRQVIRQLDAHPDRWRDCALAFLREQALTQSMRQIADQSVSWQAETSANENAASDERAAASDERAAASDERTKVQIGDGHSKPTLPSRDWSTSKRWLAMASLATTAMIGFVLGQSWNGLSSAPHGSLQAEPSRDLVAKGAADASIAVADAGSAQSSAVSTIENRGTNFDDNSSNKLAGYGNYTGQLLPIDLAIPERLRELERLGKIRIDSASAVMPLRRDDGSSVLVPIQQLQIVPVVYSY